MIGCKYIERSGIQVAEHGWRFLGGVNIKFGTELFGFFSAACLWRIFLLFHMNNKSRFRHAKQKRTFRLLKNKQTKKLEGCG